MNFAFLSFRFLFMEGHNLLISFGNKYHQIDLSENNLSNATSLERMSCFKALLSLHLRNCKLPSLPWDVVGKSLTSLKVLDAPGNCFVEVPMHLLPDSISNLNLANNNIESLGDDIHLPNLIKLDLQNNKNLVRLPIKLSTPRYVCESYSELICILRK